MDDNKCNKSCDFCSSCSTKKVDEPFCVDWADSSTKMLDPAGNVIEMGTVLLLCNNIIFLRALTDQQLSELIRVVDQAVTHEFTKRKA